MRRFWKSIVLGASVVSLLGLGLLTAATSSAGNVARPFIIDKVVEGTQPEGTQFIIRYICTVQNSPPPNPEQVVLNGPGNAVDAMIPFAQQLTTCAVTEPGDGGATSVTFSCEATGAVSCDPSGSTAYFPAGPDPGEATITVTNTYEEPEPEPEAAPAFDAIEASPSFTG